MKRLTCAVFPVLLAFAAARLPAESAGFPDNHTVRQQLSHVIFASIPEVLAAPSAVYQDLAGGTPVRFEVLTQEGGVYLLFTNKENGRFPLDSKGSYIIKRNERDGAFVQMKIFLNGSPESFIRIFPEGERARMNVYLYGFRMYNDVILPVRFSQLLTDSFSKVVALTNSMVDWPLVFPGSSVSEDRVVHHMVTSIRQRLPLLRDQRDGPAGANGKFDYFKHLEALSHGGFSCSGFAKWVIDGLYRPRTGRLISIEFLTQKHLELRGNRWSSPYERSRDPYFGLDWARNLSLALTRLDNPSEVPTSNDVTSVPFFDYIANVGYPIAHIRFVLYELAVQNPGNFYLGAINREYGSDPVLREFTHVVVLFPYFDANGLFQVAVVEHRLESGVKSLVSRFAHDYIQLEQVEASRVFDPPMPRQASGS